MTILTAGHSNRSFDEFTNLLLHNGVQVLVDVRSRPVSRYCPWFNRSYLEKNLPMQYAFRGATLGGLDPSIPYDAFEESIEELIRFSKMYRVCVLCSEKDHTKCHRFTRISPALQERGVKVLHI